MPEFETRQETGILGEFLKKAHQRMGAPANQLGSGAIPVRKAGADAFNSLITNFEEFAVDHIGMERNAPELFKTAETRISQSYPGRLDRLFHRKNLLADRTRLDALRGSFQDFLDKEAHKSVDLGIKIAGLPNDSPEIPGLQERLKLKIQVVRSALSEVDDFQPSRQPPVSKKARENAEWGQALAKQYTQG